ncbi:hypothetical protein CLF_106103 [Clonorchis sinensis]|uniref:Uncharacterized protein n=1 Tax=Clonorchis sinensis TaxID=79923 RepID=G7YEQ3_CLOSI|nr:hypothetical protein CLF_106103 [Clonorchis sinensis]
MVVEELKMFQFGCSQRSQPTAIQQATPVLQNLEESPFQKRIEKISETKLTPLQSMRLTKLKVDYPTFTFPQKTENLHSEKVSSNYGILVVISPNCTWNCYTTSMKITWRNITRDVVMRMKVVVYLCEQVLRRPLARGNIESDELPTQILHFYGTIFHSPRYPEDRRPNRSKSYQTRPMWMHCPKYGVHADANTNAG